LDFQLSELLARFVLPPEWAAELNRLVDKRRKRDLSNRGGICPRDAGKDCLAGRQNCPASPTFFIEQDIERGDYLERRHALMSEKRSLQEQSLLLERDAHRLARTDAGMDKRSASALLI